MSQWNKTQALSLLAAAALSACTLGPQYTRPDAADVKDYTQESLSGLAAGGLVLDQGRVPAAQWWSVVGSPELDATMQAALTGNRTLEEARARLAQAQFAVSAATGAQLPQVGLDAGVGREQYGAQFSGPQRFPAFNYYSIGPGVRYTLDYTGALRRGVEQQQALAEVRHQELQAAYLSLTGNVARQALMIASARAQIAAVEALIEQDRRNTQLVQTAFEAGAVSRVDVLAAQSQLANDQTLLPPLRQQLSLAQHALAVLVGQPPGAWTPPAFELASLHLPEHLPLTLPSELVRRRPDILAAEAQLHAATAAIGIAQAQRYPQLVLSANLGQQATKLDQLFDPASTAWGLAGALTAPLFDGGRLEAGQRGAEAAARAAAAHWQQTVLEAYGQVADALAALAHDGEQLAAQQAAIKTASASRDLAAASYQAGNSGVLQVLDAQRLYQQALLGVLRAQAAQAEDVARLILALGGGEPLGLAFASGAGGEGAIGR